MSIGHVFCEIDTLAAEARRTLDNGGDHKTACGYLVAVQAKAQLGVQTAEADARKLAAFDGLLSIAKQAHLAGGGLLDLADLIGHDSKRAADLIRGIARQLEQNAHAAIVNANKQTAPEETQT